MNPFNSYSHERLYASERERIDRLNRLRAALYPFAPGRRTARPGGLHRAFRRIWRLRLPMRVRSLRESGQGSLGSSLRNPVREERNGHGSSCC